MQSIHTPKIKVTLLRSFAGRSESQRKTLVSLGLSKIGSTRILPNVNPILGQVNKVTQFIKVEQAEQGVLKRKLKNFALIRAQEKIDVVLAEAQEADSVKQVVAVVKAKQHVLALASVQVLKVDKLLYTAVFQSVDLKMHALFQ